MESAFLKDAIVLAHQFRIRSGSDFRHCLRNCVFEFYNLAVYEIDYQIVYVIVFLNFIILYMVKKLFIFPSLY